MSQDPLSCAKAQLKSACDSELTLNFKFTGFLNRLKGQEDQWACSSPERFPQYKLKDQNDHDILGCVLYGPQRHSWPDF